MCLFTSSPCAFIAHEDIIAYKVVRVKYKYVYDNEKRRFVNEDDFYFTPYMMTKIPEECFENGKPFEAVIQNGYKRENALFVARPEGKFEVGDGYVHTFVNLYDAKWFAKCDCLHTRIFKVKIPKGTLMVAGLDNVARKTYASKEIVFIEKIED